jgi:hypothetical protein
MSTTDMTPTDFLNQGSGSGHPGVKFPEIGAEVKGTIVAEPKVVKTPNLSDGALEPKLVLEVLTEVETYVSDGNKGTTTVKDEIVAVWINKGWMSGALRDAVQKAGANGVFEGGRVHIRYSGDGEKKPGRTPAKLYEASYKAPPAGVPFADL